MASSDPLRLPTPPPSYCLPALPPSYSPFDSHSSPSPRKLWRQHCRERMQMLHRFLTVLKRQVREMDTLAAGTDLAFQQHRSEAETVVSLLPAYNEDPEGYATRAALFDETRSSTAAAAVLANETRKMQKLMGALVQNMLLEDRKMADSIQLSDFQRPLFE
ncbi:hypothetical protein EWM64_g339 [Hericium alpestre]|uniref:Uncharacterized protein n=1 Tax=Hericium alpestre TaxID=135208 RepID=A0A4Z0ABE2_9AGAM|nr:hypothetical protein EWM64_g339 [Hericium alpestre]